MDIWGLGDYSMLARRLVPAAQALVDTTQPLEMRKVLDLAAGTGNVAVLAAATGAEVTACDSSPRLVEVGRARTGAQVEWVQADAEDLPFPDGCFDVVLSSFGLIFAARPEPTVAHTRRVLATGGVLAFTAWTTDGAMARMNRTMAGYVPPRPGAVSPISWGDPDVLAQRLGQRFSTVKTQVLSLPWQFESGAAMTEFLLAHSPVHMAAARLAGDRASEMFAAMQAQLAPEGGPVDIEAEYLLITARAC